MEGALDALPWAVLSSARKTGTPAPVIVVVVQSAGLEEGVQPFLSLPKASHGLAAPRPPKLPSSLICLQVESGFLSAPASWAGQAHLGHGSGGACWVLSVYWWYWSESAC